MTDFDEDNMGEIITEMKISRQDINSGRLNTYKEWRLDNKTLHNLSKFFNQLFR